MKLAFSTLGCPKWDLDYVAEILARSDYDGVEIRGKENEHIGSSSGSEERNRVRKIFESRNIEILSVTAYTKFAERTKHNENQIDLKEMITLASDFPLSRSYLARQLRR